MNTQSRTRLHRAGARAGGFTLTELLVVVSILGLLMAMLVPSLHQAVTVAQRRGGCGSNQRAIIMAARQYALADRFHRLPTVFDRKKPDTKWGNVVTGNPGCLWLLVSEKHCSRTAFLCPEAGGYLEWQSPSLDANYFIYDEASDISTLSYSFISMARNNNWEDDLPGKMTMSQVPGTLVVLADKNPRTKFNTETLLTYSAIDIANGGNLGDKARNSLNHRRMGQTITRWDGSAVWVDDANDSEGNDVYTSSVENRSHELQGRRGEMIDPFLIP